MRLLSIAVPALAAMVAAQQPHFSEDVAPVLEDWCFGCHGGDEPEAGLDLETLPQRRWMRFLETVRKMRDKVAAGQMPPPDFGALSAEERDAVLAWTRGTVRDAVADLPPAPGRIVIRRLSRAEYDNTVRDLFGVRTGRTAAFPAGDLGYGFDNIGDALSFSQLHLEKYLAAAADIAARVIDSEDPGNPTVRRFEAETMKPDHDRVSMDTDLVRMYSRARVTQRVELPRPGRYRLRILAHGDQAGDEPARMAVTLDDRRIALVDVPETAPSVKERELDLPGGTHRIGLAFVNDFYRPEHPDPKQRDRNLMVDFLEVVGPLDRREPPDGSRWLLGQERERNGLAGRFRPLVRELLARAWRRPPEGREVRRLIALMEDAVEAGDSPRIALRQALQAALVSPHFLFRVEAGGTRGREGRAVPLTDHQVASRLSYFLWASMPDERLRDRADAGGLRDADLIAAEAERMLDDPRAESLATHFAAQWLELRNLHDVTPDPERFPECTPSLRADLRRETELLFLTVLREDRDVRELLDADFTFVNEALADYYGIEGVEGPGFRRVDLPAHLRHRGGMLGHAGIHVLTSNPTRTSPVKRGKWVLENLLAAPPPPPPPGFDSLPEEAEIDSAATLRESLARHRSEQRCAVCHDRMDAIGLTFERFDAAGRWRTEDEGGEIDASAVLPDGRRIEGLAELKAVLVADPAFLRCLLEKLFVYAVGREASVADLLRLDVMAEDLHAREGRVTLRDLVLGVVRMDAFHHRDIVR